ncbi:bile acid:sodium symporter family protein [Bacillus taeanensis]|uniref:Bile acid:sodium symporter family protein n=1 Tax=Bacillus taeanensis TaxID=273032 RepID=A0A366XN83_9BACI|nr:bile acid:sodium symporter [Bacillus taeanensis]RBW67367.1 hypothetical protein DS031_22465 [Bacillus taeanensis]
MGMMKSVNIFLEKWIFLILPLLMTAGFLTGDYLNGWSDLTAPLFMILTFISSLSADWRKFTDILKRPALFLAVLIIIHLLFPFFTLKIAVPLFSNQPELMTGLVLTMVLPIGVTSIFWISFVKGNVNLALLIVTLDTLLSPIILPAALYSMLESNVHLDVTSLILGLLKLVLIPSVLGMVAGEWLRKHRPGSWFKTTSSFTSKICLYLIVILNAASLYYPLQKVGNDFYKLFITIFTLMAIGYVISYVVGMFFVKDTGTRIAVSYSGGVRNYTAGVVLAMSYFTPVVALPVLIAMLLQHPLAMIFYLIFNKLSKRKDQKIHAVSH